MKKVKILASLAALMTLGLAACTDTPAESVEGTSAAATSQAASASSSKAATSSKASSSKASSSKSTGPDYTQVITRNWTDGTPANNADGKQYIPMTDSTANKVGVKIAVADWTIAEGATAGTKLDSDGKIYSVNDENAAICWKIKAPKAGAYQMIMTAKTSSSGVGKTLSERSVSVKLNGTEIDIQDSRDPLTEEMAQWVVAPTINLTGNEDTVTLIACGYRPVFDMTSYVIFSEH